MTEEAKRGFLLRIVYLIKIQFLMGRQFIRQHLNKSNLSGKMKKGLC